MLIHASVRSPALLIDKHVPSALCVCVFGGGGGSGSCKVDLLTVWVSSVAARLHTELSPYFHLDFFNVLSLFFDRQFFYCCYF